jgi:2'-5' RNA ligase
VTLAVCLLLDEPLDRAVRRLWGSLEAAGVSTLLSHTHGRHVPHVSYATLRDYRSDALVAALSELPEAGATSLHFDALGLFRRSRCWLVPAMTSDLVARQEAVVAAALATGANLHRHYRPGAWVPHLSLAPRLHLDELATAARLVYDVLPLTGTVSRVALIDTSTGEQLLLPHLV